MNISLLKPFWHFISNRHVEEEMGRWLIAKVQMMNQYAFMMSCIVVFDAFRNLVLGRSINFLVLLTIGGLIFILSWYTKLYFRRRHAAFVLTTVTMALFYFCSVTGFYNGIAPYYFTILFAALFIFNEDRRLYHIFMFLWIFILFYLVQFSNLAWSNGIWQNQICFNDSQQTTLLQFLLLLMVNGYFIMLKNNQMQKLYHEAIHTLPRVDQELTTLPVSVSVQELVELAKEDDAAFTVVFREVFPSFYSNLHRINPDMTPEEFKLCAHLKLGFTTKDIANYNHLAVRTVQTKKSRLRKSFAIPPQEDLYIWISKF